MTSTGQEPATNPTRATNRTFPLGLLLVLGGLVQHRDAAFAAPLIYTNPTSGVYLLETSSGQNSQLVANGTVGIAYPAGIAPLLSGNFLIVDQQTEVVTEFEQNGNLIDLHVDDTMLKLPARAVIGPDGGLYIIAQVSGFDEIRQYDHNGQFVKTFVPLQSNRQMTALAWGPDKNLYVTTSSGNNESITRFNGTTGEFIEVIAENWISDTDARPSGITFGPYGQIYVTERATGPGEDIFSDPQNRIRRFSPNGHELEIIAEAPFDMDVTDFYDLTFGADGKMYVLTPTTIDTYRIGRQTSSYAGSYDLNDLVTELTTARNTATLKFAANTYLQDLPTAIDTHFNLLDKAYVSFSDLKAAGTTSIASLNSSTEIDQNFFLDHHLQVIEAFDVSTTAFFDGSMALDLELDPSFLGPDFNGNQLRLYWLGDGLDPTFIPTTKLIGFEEVGNEEVPTEIAFVLVSALTQRMGTFVLAAAVPEAGSLCLVGIGVAAALLVAGRRSLKS